jgi:hypothetical protein
MPTARIFLAVGRNDLALQDHVARRGPANQGDVPRILPRYHLQRPRPILRKEANHSQIRKIIPCPPYSRSASSLFSSCFSCAFFRIESLSNGSVASLLQCQARAASSCARGRGTGAWFCFRGHVFGLHDGLAPKNPSSVLPLDGRTSLASLSVGGDLWMMGRSYSGLRRCHDGEGQPRFSRLLRFGYHPSYSATPHKTHQETQLGNGARHVLLPNMIVRYPELKPLCPKKAPVGWPSYSCS